MPDKVFWSWQSDRPSKFNRQFLKDVIVQAIEQAADNLGLDERPEIDHDVQGTAGMVSIPETILEKIDAAAVFVADITPVAVSPDGRHVANPNVLIELGYAKKALGPERIILVWNGAWEGCRPEDLPFDLRHRRAPFTYVLSESNWEAERSKVRDALVSGLAGAIAASLERVSRSTTPIVERIPARSDDPSVWFEPGTEIAVNAGTSYGADRVTFEEGPRAYMRIVPSDWPGDPLQGVRDSQPELSPLGDISGLSWGRARGGVLVYNAESREGSAVVARTATQWFRSNGEIWGIDSRATYDAGDGHTGIATTYVLQCWQRFLRRHARTLAEYRAEGPFDVEAGMTGIEKLVWPRGPYDSTYQPAIEDVLVTRSKLDELNEDSIHAFMEQAATSMRYSFGFEPFSSQNLDQILSDPLRQ